MRRIVRCYARKLPDSKEISHIPRNTVRVIRERSSGITGREYTTTPEKSRISRGLLSVLYARNLTDYQKREDTTTPKKSQYLADYCPRYMREISRNYKKKNILCVTLIFSGFWVILTFRVRL